MVIPKRLRDELVGLNAGSHVQISREGEGLKLVPLQWPGRLVEERGRPVVAGKTAIDDNDVFRLIDAVRR